MVCNIYVKLSAAISSLETNQNTNFCITADFPFHSPFLKIISVTSHHSRWVLSQTHNNSPQNHLSLLSQTHSRAPLFWQFFRVREN